METVQPESQLQQPIPVEKKYTWRHFILDLREIILLAVLLVGINAVFAKVRVDGSCMRPTLQDNEKVLVNRLAYKFERMPQRGDIIVFRFPMDPREDLIKRVIGLPGEEISVQDGRVMVNGSILDEPYIAASPAYAGKWSVPEDHLFVLGDNRNDSSDSHSWGFVPIRNVVGKAVLIYWPPLAWNLIDYTRVAIAAP